MSEAGNEKRKYPRLDTRIRVEIEYHSPDNGSQMGAGLSRDLSLGGLSFFHPEKVETDNHVLIRCYLPGSSDKPVEFFGRVIRVEFIKEQEYLVCIKFLRYERESRDLLKDYLSDFFF